MENGFFGLSGIFALFVFVAGILAILMPFFIFRIRNEAIKTNKLLTQLVKLAGKQLGDQQTVAAVTGKKVIKTCTFCGKENRAKDYTCISCGEGLPG